MKVGLVDSNNKVVNTVVVKSKKRAKELFPDYTVIGGKSIYIDGSYNPKTGKKTPPIDNPKPDKPIVYKNISQIDFIDLCQEHGGMTDDLLVQSKEDASLKALWIKFDLAGRLPKDSDKVTNGLTALENAGYLPDGKQKVLDNWPTK